MDIFQPNFSTFDSVFFTWDVKTFITDSDSFHPAAAVGERLLVGQIENQTQQRRLPPLWRKKTCRKFNFWTKRKMTECEKPSPFSHSRPLTPPSLQSPGCRAPGGEMFKCGWGTVYRFRWNSLHVQKPSWAKRLDSPRCHWCLGCSHISSAAPLQLSGNKTQTGSRCLGMSSVNFLPRSDMPILSLNFRFRYLFTCTNPCMSCHSYHVVWPMCEFDCLEKPYNYSLFCRVSLCTKPNQICSGCRCAASGWDLFLINAGETEDTAVFLCKW